MNEATNQYRTFSGMPFLVDPESSNQEEPAKPYVSFMCGGKGCAYQGDIDTIASEIVRDIIHNSFYAYYISELNMRNVPEHIAKKQAGLGDVFALAYTFDGVNDKHSDTIQDFIISCYGTDTPVEYTTIYFECNGEECMYTSLERLVFDWRDHVLKADAITNVHVGGFGYVNEAADKCVSLRQLIRTLDVANEYAEIDPGVKYAESDVFIPDGYVQMGNTNRFREITEDEILPFDQIELPITKYDMLLDYIVVNMPKSVRDFSGVTDDGSLRHFMFLPNDRGLDIIYTGSEYLWRVRANSDRDYDIYENGIISENISDEYSAGVIKDMIKWAIAVAVAAPIKKLLKPEDFKVGDEIYLEVSPDDKMFCYVVDVFSTGICAFNTNSKKTFNIYDLSAVTIEGHSEQAEKVFS